MAQITGHLRPYDVAINELKNILIALGEAVPVDVMPSAGTPTLQAVRPHMHRARDPRDMATGDDLTPDQVRALERARDKSPQLEAAVRAANPLAALAKAVGKG